MKGVYKTEIDYRMLAIVILENYISQGSAACITDSTSGYDTLI